METASPFKHILRSWRIEADLEDVTANPFSFQNPKAIERWIESLRPYGTVEEVEYRNPVSLGTAVVVLDGVVGQGYLRHKSTLELAPYTLLIPGSAATKLPEEYPWMGREALQHQGARVLVLEDVSHLPPDAAKAWQNLLEQELLRQTEWQVFIRRYPPQARMAILLHFTGKLRASWISTLTDVPEAHAKHFLNEWKLRVLRLRDEETGS